VLYERTDVSEGAALAMYHAIFHGKTLVNGYSGYTSPGAAYTTYRLLEFPSPSARGLLAALDVRAVLVRDADAAGLARRLASVPDADVLARDDTSALLRVPPRPSPPPAPATPLPRTGWTLAATAGADALPALLDGDPATRWRVDAERDAPPSLTVDLGAVHSVAGVRCGRGGLEAFGVHLADVATSIDGVAWTPTGAQFEPDSLVTLFARPVDVRWWEARFPAVDARFVRLTNPRLAFFGGPWEIAELDVLTPAAGSAR
jgi:F5/8 type C domain-containing protein